MPRNLAAAVLALHGLIHLIGFVVPWRIAALEGFAYRTSALNGALELGDPGARLVGLAWLVLAIAFVVAAVAVWRRARWAAPTVGALAVASLAVCALGLPETIAGIAVNAAILAALAVLSTRGGDVAPAR